MISKTKTGLQRRGPRLVGAGAPLVGFTLLLTTAATVVGPPAPVGADQVSDLKTQAVQITQDLLQEQLQIGAYQQQYDVDVAKIQRDAAEIASSQDQIHSDVDRVRRDRKRLQTEAVTAYINSGSESVGSPPLFEVNQSKALAKAQYEAVVSGDITNSMAALRVDENGLRAQRATLEQREARDQAITSEQATLNSAAHQAEVQLASKQSQIAGKLATAVAQQQVVQAAAAAAAVRAAQATASTATTTTTRAEPGATPTVAAGGVESTAAGDPSLPPFLQCVLQAESGGNYGAVSPGGTYMGGFQFSQPTWNEAAQLAGMPQLINVPPNEATPAEQDDLAIALYNADGQQPWNDRCHN